MKSAIAPLLVGAAAAASIKSDSRAGRKMLSKARRLDGNGELGNWAVGYSLKFEKCGTSDGSYGYFGGEGGDGGGGGGNGNYQFQQRLVHFKLCPTESCGGGCSGGDYVLDMNEFLMGYIEYKQEAMEQQCEMVAENCYCENANDDEACEAQCYMAAGIYEDCVEQDNGGNGQEFELQRAVECGELDVDEEAAQYYAYQNGDGNYYNNQQNGGGDVQFFVGPYCSKDGGSINLGVFLDEWCSFDAPEGIYEKFNYGQALPYSSESIVDSECISCMQVDNDNNNNNQNGNNNYNYNYNNGNNNNNNGNNNNNNGDVEILEMCERMYEDAGKCESNIENAYGFYPNTYACDFIKGMKKGGVKFSRGRNVTPKVLASLFAVTTMAFAGVAYYFHQRLQRQNVNLVDGPGAMA